jgi:hypothetical protein
LHQNATSLGGRGPGQAALSTLQIDRRALHFSLGILRLDRDRLLVPTRHQAQIGGKCRSLGHIDENGGWPWSPIPKAEAGETIKINKIASLKHRLSALGLSDVNDPAFAAPYRFM